MSAEILKTIPISGSYLEKHFGDSFKKSLWVKFSTNDSQEWIGCFGSGDGILDKVVVNSSNNCALVISSGRGYLVDINSKDEKFEMDEYTPIESAHYFTKADEFLFSTFQCIHIIDVNRNLFDIEPNFGVDGIFITEESENKVIGHLYAYAFSTDYNVGFEIDMTTKQLKIDSDRLYNCITHEKITTAPKSLIEGFLFKVMQLFK